MKEAKVLKMLTEVAMNWAKAGASFPRCVRPHLLDGQEKSSAQQSAQQ